MGGEEQTIDSLVTEFKDSTNDMTMVQAAGLGLAMENAVPELKATADAVICTNEEHSIQYILKHYIEP
jgi:hydroxymethylpyrimidine pyrophosphatase-like HAD family hydrolase